MVLLVTVGVKGLLEVFDIVFARSLTSDPFSATNVNAKQALDGHNGRRLAVALALSDMDGKIQGMRFLERLLATVLALKRHGDGKQRQYKRKHT